MTCYVLVDKETVDLLYKEGEEMKAEIERLDERCKELWVANRVAVDFLEKSEGPFYAGMEVLKQNV